VKRHSKVRKAWTKSCGFCRCLRCKLGGRNDTNDPGKEIAWVPKKGFRKLGVRVCGKRGSGFKVDD